ncbi:chloride channel [Scleroderma yunnanense]
MSLHETRSSSSLDLSGVGPFRGSSSTSWRRQRLLRLGSDHSIETTIPVESPRDTEEEPIPDETTSLQPTHNNNHYGTVPSLRARVSTLFRQRRPPNIEFRRTMSASAVPPSSFSPTSRHTLHWPISQRPISAYDAPLVNPKSANHETDINVRINGFRVWYSSFSSIDWLHDTIKDSVRFSRLRRGKSLRSRVRLAFDKCLGWIIVTIVGFLTAILAFLVVRSEQWFFDSKYGYCTNGWWKSQHFCCPTIDDLWSPLDDGNCPHWRRWSDVVRSWTHNEPSSTFESDYVEYSVSTCVAILLATASCLLTIYLTASTSFLTRKEPGVLSPLIDNHKGKQDLSSVSQPKRQVLYYAAGSGIPEIKTILSGFVIHGYLGGRTLFTKSLGLALSVGSGLSLGKEGPFVHIASCVGNIVSRCHSKYENNEAKRREILSAACAAGVAVAFGAPIGGTLFSLEEVSYFFPPKVMWRSFFCAMIAAIMLKFLDPFGTGKLVLFQVTYDKDWHAYELILFVLLGALGGVYGAYFSKLNYRWSRDVRNRTWLKDHPVFEVILVTLVTSLFCFLNPYARMAGTELVYNLFAECKPGSQNRHFGLCVQDPGSLEHVWPVVQLIVMTMVMKGALTIVTFGIKLPAGIFIPTLGVGACAGRLLGIMMRYFQWNYPDSGIFSACGRDKDCVIPGLYAMVGAAAALSGVTRTTVSLAVIMFELTDTLTYAVPVMLSVLVAKTVADALEPKGIYDLVIELSQLPYLDAKHEYLWADFSIGDVTDRDVDTISLNQPNTVKSLRDQLQSLLNAGHDDGGFPILRANGDRGRMRMVGFIGANELKHALAMVADELDGEVRFETTYAFMGRDMTASFSSWAENGQRPEEDPLDFSVYMDEAPLTIQSNSPLPLVHQFFVKLGARYVIVTNTNGDYEGVIDKKSWLAFLSELESKS